MTEHLPEIKVDSTRRIGSGSGSSTQAYRKAKKAGLSTSWLTAARVGWCAGLVILVVTLGSMLGVGPRVSARKKSPLKPKAGVARSTSQSRVSPKAKNKPQETSAEQANGQSHNQFAADYSTMIRDKNRRVCSEVFCSLERYANNGSIVPQSRTYDLTLTELGNKHGVSTAWTGNNAVSAYHWRWSAASVNVPLSIWTSICGTARVGRLAPHGSGFSETNVNSLEQTWGSQLTELAFDAADGTLYLVGSVSELPGAGKVFKPHEVLVIPSEDPARRDLADSIKREFRNPPEHKQPVQTASNAAAKTKEDIEIEGINKKIMKLRGELVEFQPREGEDLVDFKKRIAAGGGEEWYYRGEKIKRDIGLLEEEKQRIRSVEAEARDPRSKLSEYAKGVLDGVKRAKSTRAYVTTFPDTLNERAFAFWYEDLPKYKKAAEASEYWRGFYESAIKQWRKEGLPVPKGL